jgi:hypothetical protein
MRSSVWLIAACGAFAPLLFASTADAQPTFAVDADANVPVSTPSLTTGLGFGLRVGHRFKIPLIAFTPEVGGSYHGFNGDQVAVGVSRIDAGGRIGIGEIFRLSAYGHIGYGFTSYSSDTRGFGGLTWDLGGALDFTLLPIIDIGIHADYSVVTSAGNPDYKVRWVDLGPHVAFVF